MAAERCVCVFARVHMFAQILMSDRLNMWQAVYGTFILNFALIYTHKKQIKMLYLPLLYKCLTTGISFHHWQWTNNFVSAECKPKTTILGVQAVPT